MQSLIFREGKVVLEISFDSELPLSFMSSLLGDSLMGAFIGRFNESLFIAEDGGLVQLRDEVTGLDTSLDAPSSKAYGLVVPFTPLALLSRGRGRPENVKEVASPAS